MNTIQQILAMSVLAVGAVLPTSSTAQTPTGVAKPDASQSASMTDGEVRKVDQEIGKITIKHGEIKHLDMPGMTMAFTVVDKRLLDNVKPGDKVKFMVVSERGKLIVTEIRPAR
jgi:Cu/Ag efflux protein CusF